MEGLDSVGGFLRFVDQTNRSEISSRGSDHGFLKQTSDVLNRNSIAIPLVVVSCLGLGD